jgi:hypothetical protein
MKKYLEKRKKPVDIIEDNEYKKIKKDGLLLFGSETYYITEVFKRTNLLISYKTKYCIKQLLIPKPSVNEENKFHCAGTN